jgi:hypothetical protein
LDENFGGTITTAGVWPYSSYSGDANGIGTITGTGPTIHFIGDGRFLDESVSVIMGNATVQNALSRYHGNIFRNPGRQQQRWVHSRLHGQRQLHNCFGHWSRPGDGQLHRRHK